MNKKDNVLKRLENAKRKLAKRGVNGIGVFVHRNQDSSFHDYASDMIKFLNSMTKNKTHCL